MDHGERLAKVEAIVDEQREQMNRFEREFERIHASIDALREHTDRGLAELRVHTDAGLAAQRESSDRAFAEMRQEQQKTTRWMIRLTLANAAAIIAMMGTLVAMH